jgi:Rubrerythrin
MKKNIFMAFSAIVLVVSVAFTGAIVANAQEETAPTKTTIDNLLSVYNSGMNESTRYLAFAEKAAVEGCDAAASLFRAIAAAEQARCERYSDIIKQFGREPKVDAQTPVVNSTNENLAASLKVESDEEKVMYPAFIEQAKKEGLSAAVEIFTYALAAQGVYNNLCTKMLNNLALIKGLIKGFYVCPVCGNIVDVIDRSRCQICATDTRKFRKVK